MITIAHIDELTDKVDSEFTLVHLAAKRAREINSYYSQLGEGLQQYVAPLVSTESNKPLSIALEEIATGKVEPRWVEEGEEPTDPLAFIEGDVDLEQVEGVDDLEEIQALAGAAEEGDGEVDVADEAAEAAEDEDS